jgi:hypothetical protein
LTGRASSPSQGLVCRFGDVLQQYGGQVDNLIESTSRQYQELQNINSPPDSLLKTGSPSEFPAVLWILWIPVSITEFEMSMIKM